MISLRASFATWTNSSRDVQECCSKPPFRDRMGQSGRQCRASPSHQPLSGGDSPGVGNYPGADPVPASELPENTPVRKQVSWRVQTPVPTRNSSLLSAVRH